VIDTNGDGVLDRKEMAAALDLVDLDAAKEKDMKEGFDLIDTNHDGSIDFNEFSVAFIDKEMALKIQHLRQAFFKIDDNHDG
jgi:Ca2+-binding EF-hand superfamily protein